MRNAILIVIVIFSLNIRTNALEISPYLFGQNHWIASGDEGTRIGYLNLLWLKIKESGIKCVRIGVCIRYKRLCFKANKLWP